MEPPALTRSAQPRNGDANGSSLRRAIVLRLRKDGPAAPDQLATDLGASRTGVLQQLRALEAAGLVDHVTERHGVGRPRHLYDVTADAQDLFPTAYDGLALSLLDAIARVGGSSLLGSVLAARRDALAGRFRARFRARLGPDAPLADRARELAVIQDEQGYLSETVVGPDGKLRLLQHNCAIHHVAGAEPAACAAELELYRELLGVDVVRETHIASGDRCCSYRIGPDTGRA